MRRSNKFSNAQLLNTLLNFGLRMVCLVKFLERLIFLSVNTEENQIRETIRLRFIGFISVTDFLYRSSIKEEDQLIDVEVLDTCAKHVSFLWNREPDRCSSKINMKRGPLPLYIMYLA